MTMIAIFLLNSIITNVYGQRNDKNSTEKFYPLGPLQFSAKIDIGIIIAIAALVIAFFYNAKQMANNAKQMAHSAKTYEAEFLWSLREYLIQHHDDVHKKLRPGGDWNNANKGPSTPEEWAAVEAYMGLFEHVSSMLQEGLSNDKAFNHIYRYRLANILHNNVIKKEKLEKRGDSWQEFITLCRKVGLENQLPPSLWSNRIQQR
jgi:hypothetical protein